MKIGVISDTHFQTGHERLPEEVVEALSEVDLIIHCGDFCVYGVFENLKGIGKGEVLGVCGNMDSEEVRKALPQRVVFELEGHQIGVIHGSGPPDGIKERIRGAFRDIEGIELIIYGHTHAPSNEVIEGILFFNPGSPTDKIFARYNSYGIITVEEDDITGEIIQI
ncbi:MAG: metallophosphoesterase [Candidatus Syntrophoarchaeum sp. WYZ-LMO15]|nr:MAG: metallophosphoesterase [Candidatus Syntrophoarchaeum sp. WYZ-LMO15]